jgi:hypothetical protein
MNYWVLEKADCFTSNLTVYKKNGDSQGFSIAYL